MAEKQKIQRLFKQSYLAMIENSPGTKMFRNFYVKADGKKKDNTRNGVLSCAFFVSSVLVMFGLIGKIRLSIDGLIEEMRKYSWKKLNRPRKGSVLVWEAKKFGDEVHKHIGFYIGNSKAISNSYKKRRPTLHHWTFNGERKVEAIFWHKKLDKEIGE